MRRVLVDRARRMKREKHGGNRKRFDLHDSAVSGGCTPEEILAISELFDLLAEKHAAEAEVAKLRNFAGFNRRSAGNAGQHGPQSLDFRQGISSPHTNDAKN